MTSIDPIDSGSRLDPGDRAVAVVGDPDGFAADRDGARVAADRDRVADRFAAVDVDPADRVVAGVGDPDDAGAGVDPARAGGRPDRRAEQRPGRRVDPGDACRSGCWRPRRRRRRR